MSEIRVTNVLGENGNSPVNFTKGINMSGIVTATSFVPSQGQLSHRNLIINGAMNVAQRGTSSTSAQYQTVDRFKFTASGADELPSQAQVDVASGTTPYTLGFRKAYKITNGNQTSGAGASDNVLLDYRMESQDIASSGWNYKSASSFITLSFWVKSSVAQEFHGFLLSQTGGQYLYSFSLGSLSANTWTKVTKTIPGNSNLNFDNSNLEGLLIRIALFQGTNKTGTITQNQWAAFNGSIRYPNYTSTWYTTNDATFEYTGVQLEVGPVATPFEHRSFGDELRRCQRYYFGDAGSGLIGFGRINSQSMMFSIQFPTEMRSNPSMSLTTTGALTIAEPGESNFYPSSCTIAEAHGGTKSKAFYINSTTNNSVTKGDNVFLTANYLKFDAEL